MKKVTTPCRKQRQMFSADNPHQLQMEGELAGGDITRDGVVAVLSSEERQPSQSKADQTPTDSSCSSALWQETTRGRICSALPHVPSLPNQPEKQVCMSVVNLVGCVFTVGAVRVLAEGLRRFNVCALMELLHRSRTSRAE